MSKAPRRPETPEHGPGTKVEKATGSGGPGGKGAGPTEEPVVLQGFLWTKLNRGWVLLEVTVEDGVIVEKFPCSKEAEPWRDMTKRLFNKVYEILLGGGKQAKA